MSEDPAAVAFEYHQRTRHAPHAYARSLAWMDWDSQPDPFRRYTGAPVVLLDRDTPETTVPYDAVLEGDATPPAPIGAQLISRLFLDSLALSAWKQVDDTRWSLRVNPSSGNLHPTEAYLVSGAIPDVGETPAVYHYHPYLHGLEQRAVLPEATWRAIAGDLPAGAVLIGLTSIMWRESWKYGERAFRYCQHDLGHAIACVTIAARGLGWHTRVLDSVPDRAIAALLGVAGQAGIEAELPECLLAVYPATADFPLAQWRHLRLPPTPPLAWQGVPAQLSSDHHEWPVLDVVAAATTRREPPPAGAWQPAPLRAPNAGRRPAPLSPLVRQRRSAVSMDGKTPLSRAAFFRTLHRVMPGAPPFDALPWAPAVHLFLFVHRVEGLPAGVYALARSDTMRPALDATSAWEQVEPSFPLFRVHAADVRALAQGVSCGQDIAADGAFAVGMVADLRGGMAAFGAPFYRRLHWEAGAIGQVLYLEAESDGVRATGIGCFYDDTMHTAVGIPGSSGWKTLYHFTVGGPVDDERLRTLAPYAHLE